MLANKNQDRSGVHALPESISRLCLYTSSKEAYGELRMDGQVDVGQRADWQADYARNEDEDLCYTQGLGLGSVADKCTCTHAGGTVYRA
jgi:hypothetical protein